MEKVDETGTKAKEVEKVIMEDETRTEVQERKLKPHFRFDQYMMESFDAHKIIFDDALEDLCWRLNSSLRVKNFGGIILPSLNAWLLEIIDADMKLLACGSPAYFHVMQWYLNKDGQFQLLPGIKHAPGSFLDKRQRIMKFIQTWLMYVNSCDSVTDDMTEFFKGNLVRDVHQKLISMYVDVSDRKNQHSKNQGYHKSRKTFVARRQVASTRSLFGEVYRQTYQTDVRSA